MFIFMYFFVVLDRGGWRKVKKFGERFEKGKGKGR